MSDSFNVSDNQARTLQKYKMRRHKGPKATLPTGIVIDATEYVGTRPPGSDQAFVLHSPEQILKNPKAGCKYVWMLRSEDLTIGLVETHQLRPITSDEIDRNRTETAHIRFFAGPGNKSYVGWKRMALFEASKETTYEWYIAPERYAMSKTVGLSDAFSEKVEQATQGKMSGAIEVTKAEKPH